jgi:acyl-CoA synthetase (AMP-forming)/AMP-acid ligase II
VWVAGPHIPTGYWSSAADDAAPFGARLAAPADETRYLRTGDLGFLDADGELYVTGRIKDLIICHGQNFHAQDIEATSALAHPTLDPQRGIAFGVETPQGVEVVLLQELLRKARHKAAPTEVVARIRANVLAQHGLALNRVLLLAPQALPFTTSGKKRRSAAKEQYLAGAFVSFLGGKARAAPEGQSA